MTRCQGTNTLAIWSAFSHQRTTNFGFAPGHKTVTTCKVTNTSPSMVNVHSHSNMVTWGTRLC